MREHLVDLSLVKDPYARGSVSVGRPDRERRRKDLHGPGGYPSNQSCGPQDTPAILNQPESPRYGPFLDPVFSPLVHGRFLDRYFKVL